MIQTLTNFNLLLFNHGELILIFIFPILIYLSIILYLTYFIYSLITKKNKINYIRYISLIKDKDFIFFKDSLFKLYGSILIILSVYLFKHDIWTYILDFNLYFFLSILSLIITSNYFTLVLFKLYTHIKDCVKVLNEINFNSYKIYKMSIFPYYQTRSFSTSTKFHSNDSDFELDPQMESLTKDQIIKDCTSDLDFTQNYIDYKKAKSVEEFKKTYKGGFFGYSDLKHFGNVSQFTQLTGLEHNQFQDNLENKIKDYLNEIPENIIYSVLPVLKWQYSSGDYKSLSISNSIKITRKSDRSLLAETVLHDISETLLNYNIQGLDIELIMMGRPWLKADDFNLDVSDLTLVFDEQLEREISAYSSSSVLDIKKIPDGTAILKNYEYKNIYMDNYGDPIYDKSQNLIGYKIGSNKFASIDTYYNDNNLLCNKVSIKSLSEIDSPTQDEPLISWVDTKTESGFVRYYKKNKYYYDKNNKLINKETSFTCSPFPNHKKDYRFNDKIGTIDFETFGSNVGMGHQHVYAGGWAIKNSVNLFYRKHNETSENFINKFFFSVFSNNHNIDGYTFYVHNLGRFDSIFIIKSLILNKNFFITPIWKDNCIISLSIKFLDKKITLLDSLQLIPGSLDNILKSYDCEVQKGVFPYAFVNINNLFYIGDKPSKKYFPNISDLKYDNIPENNWDLKKETLSYLKADIEGLLEAITKFNINIYNKYSLNITNFKTLPSLALAVYRSSYTPVHLAPELKMIKGELEKEIRSSYFGGNVDVYTNEVTDAYLYDLNSQYSKAMLEDMPIGDPVLSLETDLNKIFGFVYAEITCPDELNLRIPFIQFKDPIGRMTLCPRGKFKRLIFSEEAKYAIKYGYKIKVKYCYQFERGQNLFKDYVNYHYEIKQKKSGDPIQRSIAKLFLNSLYGRLGMKDIEDTIKIVSKREAEDLDKNTNVSILSELTENKFMVRYSGQINDNIRKLYKNDPVINLDKNKNASLNRKELRSSGLIKKKTVPSAVHIAAAISSYARMIINEYKNIPGNPCIMSDTDSAVLSYPLPENLVGTGLGQMKLEHKIKKGIFIRKKLYYILNSENQEIIKASGIDSSRLNYYYFVKLLSGESIEIERTNFNVEWKGLNISVVKSNILVQGLTGNLKTIHNCPDVNFKFISIYKNKRYELIIYSIQEKSIITKPNFINFISIYKPKSYSIILHPLYQLLEYICWLIKLFLFFYSEE